MKAILSIINNTYRNIEIKNDAILGQKFVYIDINVRGFGFFDKRIINKALKHAKKMGVKILITSNDEFLYAKKFGFVKYCPNIETIAYKVLKHFLERNPTQIPCIHSNEYSNEFLDCLDVSCNYAKTLKINAGIYTNKAKDLIFDNYGISISPQSYEKYIHVLLSDNSSNLDDLGKLDGLVLDFTKNMDNIVYMRNLKIKLDIGINITSPHNNDIILYILQQNPKLYKTLNVKT